MNATCLRGYPTSPEGNCFLPCDVNADCPPDMRCVHVADSKMGVCAFDAS